MTLFTPLQKEILFIQKIMFYPSYFILKSVYFCKVKSHQFGKFSRVIFSLQHNTIYVNNLRPTRPPPYNSLYVPLHDPATPKSGGVVTPPTPRTDANVLE